VNLGKRQASFRATARKLLNISWLVRKPDSPGSIADTQLVWIQSRSTVNDANLGSVGRFCVTPASQPESPAYLALRPPSWPVSGRGWVGTYQKHESACPSSNSIQADCTRLIILITSSFAFMNCTFTLG
jgi:hypothetical protein